MPAARLALSILPAGCLLLAGCLQTVGSGPDLGACSAPPDRPHTYGEIGIGTCLAGPTDLRFLDIDDRTYLAVSNADPYYSFTSGSLLLIDWASVDPTAPVQYMDQLSAHAVQTERFLGTVQLVDDRPDGTPLLLVPTRESPEVTVSTHIDDLLVFDASNPRSLKLWEPGPTLPVGRDPHHMEVIGDRAFILNLSGRNISVIDTHATPLAPVPLRGAPRIQHASFRDRAQTGAVAELAAWQVTGRNRVPSDRWTLTWLDHTYRAWQPTAQGIQRWNGGDESLVIAPAGPDVPQSAFPSDLTGPFAYTTSLDGQPIPTLAFGSGGNLFSASAPIDITSWSLDEDVLLRGDPRGGWAGWIDNPSRFVLPSLNGIAFDGRTEPGQPASIGIALSNDDLTYTREPDPVLTPPPGVSYEAPMIRPDDHTASLRMWFTVARGEQFEIAHSTSLDARDWSAPEPVTGLPDIAAHPVVATVNGRYLLWFSTPVDGEWWLARATSDDALSWYGVEHIAPHPDPADPAQPPRPAILPDPLGGFTVRADDVGRITLPSVLARNGADFNASQPAGLTFRVATGHALPRAALPESTGGNGIIPGAVHTVGGRPILYATTLGADGQRHLAALDTTSDPPTVLEPDLVPLADLELTAAFDPVVTTVGSEFVLFFGAQAESGAAVRRATSVDGLSWKIDDDPALTLPDSFAGSEIAPGSIQPLQSGGLRLWFAGFDGARWRIGSATSDDGGQSFTPEIAADGRAYQLGQGPAGAFDDVSVRAPRWFRDDGVDYLAYSGFNGTQWSLGLATAASQGDPVGDGLPTWERRVGTGDRNVAWMPPIAASFAASGVESPVPWVTETGELGVWFAGHDLARGATPRLGQAFGSPSALFPTVRNPVAGDTLTFHSLAGGEPIDAIPLEQMVDAFTVDGAGANSMRHDPERGFLYITSRTANYFYVIDVRNDSTRTQSDDNYLDVEAVVQIRGHGEQLNLRDVVPLPDGDRLYAASRDPDAALVLDGAPFYDGARKRSIEGTLLHAFPMQAEEDLAAPAFNPFAFQLPSAASAAGMAVRQQDGRNHLFVAHFSQDSLAIFDLDRGAHGTQVANVRNLGERPHLVRISPDGRYAVVASYLGDVDDGRVSSTLSVIGADPDRPDFGRLLTTLVNR